MPKTKGLTPKQRLWRKELIATLSPTEAAMRVYNCKDRHVAGNIASENLVKLGLSMADLMNKMGLTDEQDMEDLKRLRKAQRPISCNIYIRNKEGAVSELKEADGLTKDFIDIDDNPTQLRALELTHKLKGHLKDSNGNGKGSINVSILIDQRPQGSSNNSGSRIHIDRASVAE